MNEAEEKEPPVSVVSVVLDCKEDQIHFPHIKGLFFSLLESLVPSRAPEGEQSDVFKTFQGRINGKWYVVREPSAAVSTCQAFHILLTVMHA